MARPPLPLGTYGKIRSWQVDDGSWIARASFRGWDGRVRPVERWRATKNGAENALREALRDLHEAGASSEITAQTKIKLLAEAWFAEWNNDDRSPGSAHSYRSCLNLHVLPALGDLTVAEGLTVPRINRLLQALVKAGTLGTAHTVRVVIGNLVKSASGHGALTHDPMTMLAPTPSGRKRPKALTKEQAADFWSQVRTNLELKKADLPDLVGLMLATGLRVGEACAVVWDAVDLEAATVEVRGIVVRVKGKGLVIRQKPKTENGWRTLDLPSWAVRMLTDRRREGVSGDAPVFPGKRNPLRDPHAVSSALNPIREATADYGWVTSHTFRKTVCTLMDDAGIPTRKQADQLGHAAEATTQQYYHGRGGETGAAKVLEQLDPGTKPRRTSPAKRARKAAAS